MKSPRCTSQRVSSLRAHVSACARATPAHRQSAQCCEVARRRRTRHRAPLGQAAAAAATPTRTHGAEAIRGTSRPASGGRNGTNKLPSSFDPAGLHRPQRADQGQQGRLSRSGRAGHDDELTRFNLDAVVEQHPVARTAFAKEMTDFVDPHGRPRFLGVEIRHRNNSAGSAASTRLTARKPESTHIPMVRARVSTEMPKVMRSGSSVISPMM